MAELPDAPWAAPKPELPDAPWVAEPKAEPIPEAFIERVRRGNAFSAAVAKAAPKDGAEAPDANMDRMTEFGVLPDMSVGHAGMVDLHHPDKPSNWDLLGHAVLSDLSRLWEETKTLPQRAFQESEKLRTEGDFDPGVTIGAAMFGVGGIGEFRVNGTKFARPNIAEGRASSQVVGTLPKAEDFANAAASIKGDEFRFRQLWQERGIHPAEAAHDAQSDAFLKHDLTAYHGSPHDFDAFSLDKVGTGEGAQAYGHGVYLAESETVAGYYKGTVPNGLHPLNPKNFWTPAEVPSGKGNIYKVTVNANKDHFLDFDQPLAEQSAKVKEAVAGLGQSLTKTDFKLSDKLGGPVTESQVPRTGGDLYLDLAKNKYENYAEASKTLSDAGIPGLKYLDQGSRKSGDGTHNFVVFNDKDVKITHKNGEPTEEAQLLEHAGFTPQSLSAAVNTEPPLVPLSEQPASPPGRLMAAGREAVEQLTGLGRNIQFMLDPMATGSNRAMVITKDAINSVRRIRWDHARIDDDVMKRFTPEQQERMWNAADEESVARQLGESRENQGLATLEPEERAFIEDAHARAQSAWLHAQDAGIVESEGLPAYTPRMVLNVAAAGEHLGPRALNELGRNVFTRTSQMLHRKHMLAEETEAAARELVGDRMAKRGASVEEINAAMEKVKIARNIRALPLATARLEEAAVWREMINKIEETGKATGEETLAVGFKPDNTWFTIAGHPAFTKWEPALEKNPVTGKWGTRTDDAGNVLFVPKPMYMPAEFKGPMHAILDEGSSAMKAVPGAMSAYEGLMAIKGKAMTAILNSPLIHNEVVWSKVMEAAGGREWLGFGLYFRGNRIVNNPARAAELIERGLAPMGKRGAFQDITGMMEEPSLTAGRSWTSKILAAVPGLFDPAAELAVKQAVDKAGDFWHNTLLWDRVRDVQFGLADHLSDRLVAKGADRLTADRIGAHFSNIIVGSIPKEAMSAGARATANLFLFSRSFTLGNLSTFKQVALGLPKPILAQIERDFGMMAEDALGPLISADVKQTAQSIARRKAISTVLMSAGLYYVGNALIQHAFNIAARDSTVEEEMNGYARRYESLMSDASKDPFELRHLVGRLSPTYDNEPSKADRAHIGYDKDGTAIYARNPTGKFGEEMVGYPTMPLEMIRRKLSPLAGGILDVMENDKGFGRKIYDPNDTTVGGDIQNAFAIGKHLVMKHLPEGQITAGMDLLRGDGDPTVNKLRLFGPAAGFTASVGAPGGMARGEQLTVKSQSDIRFNLAWPDIRKQIQRGDEDGARQAMDNLGLSKPNQGSLIRSVTNPAGQLKGRTLHDFLQKATPEQRERFERARGAP